MGRGGGLSSPAATTRRSRSGAASPPVAASQGGFPFTPPPGRRAGSAVVPPSAVPPSAALQGSPGGIASSPGSASPPADWDLQSSSALVERGLLSVASEEDEAALRSQLAERLPGAEVTGTFQVSRSSHIAVYDALRATMQEQGRGEEAPLELELWHGTGWATVPKILRQGFNRSFAGRHGTLLGIATYFSTDPAYSQRFCDRRGGGKDGTKALLLSRVLIGSYCKGASSDVEPPIMDAKTGERFDSTVDNEEKPGIFAVFRDFQAVPLFLVEVRA